MYLIFTEDDGWHTDQLIEAFKNNNKEVETAKINQSSMIIDDDPRIIFEGKEIPLKNIDGAFVRGIPGGTLEEVCFHLDILHFLQLHNVTVYNNTVCIEKSVDKVRTSCILNANKIPTPSTYITSNIKDLKKFRNNFSSKLCVCKPIFGSQGKGLEILDNNNVHPDYENLNNVYYLQEYLKHPEGKFVDWRLFVINDQVIASMAREGSSWINNVANGATCKPFTPSDEMVSLAVNSSLALGMNYSGVDIMIGDNGYTVTEVNSIPAWKGLQSVYEDKNIAQTIINDFLKVCKEGGNC
ncbi:RimK family alpha-L-glutamate ligase [Gammaproteobacteria bacterium]|nr:RimK family alpha-L-glutamate ligase [Gammaproteobacteria bacterium]